MRDSKANASGRVRRARSPRKRRSSEEVRLQIVAAAGDEFGQYGYSNATTAAIAQRAEATEAQIFRLFGSKSELFRVAIVEPLDRHLASFHVRLTETMGESAPFDEAARLYIEELIDFMETHAAMLMALVTASAHESDAEVGVGGLDGLRNYFERGAAMMTPRVGENPAIDPKLLVRVSFAAVLANVMFKDWLFPRGMRNRAAVRTAIAGFVINGISSEIPTEKRR